MSLSTALILLSIALAVLAVVRNVVLLRASATPSETRRDPLSWVLLGLAAVLLVAAIAV